MQRDLQQASLFLIGWKTLGNNGPRVTTARMGNSPISPTCYVIEGEGALEYNLRQGLTGHVYAADNSAGRRVKKSIL